jgi:glycosyltransferase involved in cell wall biosynthesis
MSTQLSVWPDARIRLAPAFRACGAASVSSWDIRRALVVVPHVTPGLRTHLHCSLQAAAAAGWRFTFVAPAEGALADLRDALHSLPRNEFIGAPLKGRHYRLWPAVRSLLRDGGFDLVQSHGPTAAVQAAVGGLGIGVPHLAMLHEPLSAEWTAGLFGILRRWGMGLALQRADAIVVSGEDVRADLLSRFPSLVNRLDRIAIIPNGIPTRRAADAPGDDGSLRSRLGVAPDTKLIGCFGPFTQANGFAVLMDAVQRLAAALGAPRFHVAVFGSGEPRDERRRELERRCLAAHMTLLEATDDIYPLLRQLDLVVAPAASLEASLAAMAAMAAGVPVLGSDAPGLLELFRGTPSRAVTAGDAHALRFGLDLALSRPWTEAAREFACSAQARFDDRQTANRLQSVFDRVAGKTAVTTDLAPDAARTSLAA